MKMTESIRFRGTPLVQFGIVVFCFRKSGFWNMRFGEAAKGIPFLVCRVGSLTHKRALTTSAVSNSFFFGLQAVLFYPSPCHFQLEYVVFVQH